MSMISIQDLDIDADTVNEVNLCDSCQDSVVECKPGMVLFGTGRGNDNVCACDRYEPVRVPDPKEDPRLSRFLELSNGLYWLTDTLDCGDNSCRFRGPAKPGGMRTNSGCSCLDGLGGPERMFVNKMVYWLRELQKVVE